MQGETIVKNAKNEIVKENTTFWNSWQSSIDQGKFLQQRPTYKLTIVLNKIVTNNFFLRRKNDGFVASMNDLPESRSEQSAPITIFPF